MPERIEAFIEPSAGIFFMAILHSHLHSLISRQIAPFLC